MDKSQVFDAAIAIGVWRLRRRRMLVGIAPSKYRAGFIFVFTYLISMLFLLTMLWYCLFESAPYTSTE
jgi:hypothetical protein